MLPYCRAEHNYRKDCFLPLPLPRFRVPPRVARKPRASPGTTRGLIETDSECPGSEQELGRGADDSRRLVSLNNRMRVFHFVLYLSRLLTGLLLITSFGSVNHNPGRSLSESYHPLHTLPALPRRYSSMHC